MKKRKSHYPVIAIVLFMILFGGSAFAGVSGKISGVVEDDQTGAPLIGATIRVVGTSIVTKTDEDGEYFLIGVPVGKYDLAVSHVGFEYLIKKNVRVLVDLTTPVDFGINEVATQLTDEVVVYASEAIIQKDLTESRITFTSDRMRELPNTISLQSVLGNYPGVVEDRQQQLHVRGGRSGQTAYFYDGFSIQDPFIMGPGIRVMPNALEELSLSSGGFGAEYGDAISGVVNAVTRIGGPEYHGRFRSYESMTHQYDVTTGDWNNSLETFGNRSLAFDLSGPILGADGKKYNFYAAGEYLRNNGYLPHDWALSYTGAVKLSLQPLRNLKLTTNLSFEKTEGDIYDHRDVNGRSYDFNLDGLPAFERDAYLAGLSGNLYINERTILTASLSSFSTKRLQAPRHLLDVHYTDWEGYSVGANGIYDGTVHKDNYWDNPDYNDAYEATGFTTGDDFNPTYSLRHTKYTSITSNLLRQIGKSNQVNLGFEWRKYDIEMDYRQFFNNKPYGETYQSNPTYSSAYIQDKIEYEHFIINAGLRLSYRSANIDFNSTPDTTATWVKSNSNIKLSPRLGVSFPIGVQTAMHFNYGIYFQTPEFGARYINPQGDLNSGVPLLGNPNLLPERTTAYELGVDHVIDNTWRLDLTAYFKDIKDLVTTRQYDKGSPTEYTKYVNEDYGSAQGFDLEIKKLSSGVFSGAVSYGYMIAKGNGSDALEPYYNFGTADSTLPVSKYPLDFDQRHTLVGHLDWKFPTDWKGSLAGIAIPNNWGLSLAGNYGSGLPYTETDSQGNRLSGRNEGRLPAYYTVDMKFNKNFDVWAGKLLTFFVEVDNLFDRRNIINVYTRTGLPDDDRNAYGDGLATNQIELDGADLLYDHDPQNYSPPRTVRTGFEISF